MTEVIELHAVLTPILTIIRRVRMGESSGELKDEFLQALEAARAAILPYREVWPDIFQRAVDAWLNEATALFDRHRVTAQQRRWTLRAAESPLGRTIGKLATGAKTQGRDYV